MAKKKRGRHKQPVVVRARSAPDNEAHVVQVFTEISAELYSGPLPSPTALARFDDVVVDGAERIFSMAERQAAHRQYLERITIEGDNQRAHRGLMAGLAVALSMLAASVYLAMNGHDTIAGIVAGMDVTGLVTAFITGTIVRHRERMEKAEHAGIISK